MALDNCINFAKAIVSTGYDDSATTVVLESSEGNKLPTAPFNAVWYDATTYSDPTDDPKREIVRVTDVSTDTLTVTRAQEGTSAQTHNTGGKTYKMIAGLTAKVLNTDIPAEYIAKVGGTMTGGLVLVAGTTTVQPLKMVSGTNLTTAVAGVFEFDGTNLYFSV